MSDLLLELLQTKDKKQQRKIMNMLNRLGMDDYTINVLVHEIRGEMLEEIKKLRGE